MNSDNAQKEWTELKGKIKSKWTKLADTDVEGFKGNLNLIIDKVQKAYGITKDKAELEFSEFKKTIEMKSDIKSDTKPEIKPTEPTAAEKAKPN